MGSRHHPGQPISLAEGTVPAGVWQQSCWRKLSGPRIVIAISIVVMRTVHMTSLQPYWLLPACHPNQ